MKQLKKLHIYEYIRSIATPPYYGNVPILNIGKGKAIREKPILNTGEEKEKCSVSLTSAESVSVR